MSAADPPARAKCVRCLAGLCGHENCKPGGRFGVAVSFVGGTGLCADCTGSLYPMWQASLHETVIAKGET